MTSPHGRFGRWCAAPLVAFVAACSPPPPAKPAGQLPTHPVRGRVLVQGKPAAGAFVLFVPVNEPNPPAAPRPRATAGLDGSFDLAMYAEADGAPAGDYLVAVRWPRDGRDDEDILQGRYADPKKSGLKAAVKDGRNELPAFQLK